MIKSRAQRKKNWTNRKILRRVVLDSISGTMAAFTVSPIMLMADRSVVLRNAGKASIWGAAF